LAGLGLAGIRYFRSDSDDAALAAISRINRSELPQDWQGLSDAELRSRVDELLASGPGDEGRWWGSRFDEDQSRQLRMAALILEDGQLGVRSLCWLAHRLQYDNREVTAIEYLDVAINEAQQAGLEEELARCHYQRRHCLAWLHLYEA